MHIAITAHCRSGVWQTVQFGVICVGLISAAAAWWATGCVLLNAAVNLLTLAVISLNTTAWFFANMHAESHMECLSERLRTLIDVLTLIRNGRRIEAESTAKLLHYRPITHATLRMQLGCSRLSFKCAWLLWVVTSPAGDLRQSTFNMNNTVQDSAFTCGYAAVEATVNTICGKIETQPLGIFSAQPPAQPTIEDNKTCYLRLFPSEIHALAVAELSHNPKRESVVCALDRWNLLDEPVLADAFAIERQAHICCGTTWSTPRLLLNKIPKRSRVGFVTAGPTAALDDWAQKILDMDAAAVNEWHLRTAGSNALSDPMHRKIAAVQQFQQDVTQRMNAAPSYRSACAFETLAGGAVSEITLLKRFWLISQLNTKTHLRALTDVSYYSCREGRFLNGKPNMVFKSAFDGDSFVHVEYNSRTGQYTGPPGCDVLLMCPELEFLRERGIREQFEHKLDAIADFDFDSISIVLWEGVPGCGKTTAICLRHNKNVDVVLTAGRAARTDYLRRAAAWNGSRDMYRTYDSVLLNGAKNIVAPVIHADEGLMAHPGDILLCGLLYNTQVIEISGDRKQVPWLNRNVLFHPTHKRHEFDHIFEITSTWRLPQSAMRVMRKFYPSITSNSKIQGTTAGPTLIKTTPVLSNFALIATFTQEEKFAMQAANPGRLVLTVHEAQGQDHESVALVRLKLQDDLIYESPGHICVGLSRHKRHFEYFTVNTGDMTSTLLGNDPIDMSTTAELESTTMRHAATVETMPVQPPLSRWKLWRRSTTDYLTHPVAQFISRINGQTGRWRNQWLRLVHYTVWPPDTHSEVNFENAIMAAQTTLDLLYEPVDPIAAASRAHDSPFPLEPEFQVNYTKLLSFRPAVYTACTPLLQGPQPARLGKSIGEFLYSIRMRNTGVPLLHQILGPEVIDEMVDKFFATFIDEEKRRDVACYAPYESAEQINEFVATRDSHQLKQLESLRLMLGNDRKYDAGLRPVPKFSGKVDYNEASVAGQVLAAHSPLITARYGAYFRTLSENIKASLKSQWCMNDGLSREELNGWTNQALSTMQAFVPQEIDFSKYDKSQVELALIVVCKIMLRFGVPFHAVEDWYLCHCNTTLVFHKLGIRVPVSFQRKSGDALTWLGNTLLVMVILCWVDDLSNSKGVFGGDDSVLFHPSGHAVHDTTAHISKIFNMVAKFEEFPTAIAFSSMFLVYAEGSYYWVPDPVKALVKLTRKDMYCKEHAELYHISFCDNFRGYLNASIRCAVAEAAATRYSKKLGLDIVHMYDAVNFLASCARSSTRFERLFSADKWIWERPLPKSLREFMQKQYERYADLDIV